jgi:type II secretory pathway pseudopilin PulG
MKMNKKVLFKKRLAQIWVETVIYTLIGLTIIAAILAIAAPAIDRYKDQLVVEQTLSVMNGFDNTIKEVRDAGSGNRRIIPELMIKKGRIEIDGNAEKITYILEKTRLEYSEPGSYVEQGSMNISTEKMKSGKFYNINITLSYPGLNITNSDRHTKKTLTAASVAYKLAVMNNGTLNVDVAGTQIQGVWIVIEEIS